MRAAKIPIVLAIALILTGCVPSLHPLFTEEDLVFDGALLGAWVEKDGASTWVLKKSGDKAYELVYTEKGEPRSFQAHLAQLGPHRFMDIYPEEPNMKNELYKFHLIPAHTFSRVRLEGQVLRVQMLYDEWLHEMITARKVNIAHERLEDGILLTAPTRELQQFLRKYAEDPKAFTDPTELHRRR